MFPVQLTTSRIGNLTRLIHILTICDDHTIHTVIRYSYFASEWTPDAIHLCQISREVTISCFGEDVSVFDETSNHRALGRYPRRHEEAFL